MPVLGLFPWTCPNYSGAVHTLSPGAKTFAEIGVSSKKGSARKAVGLSAAQEYMQANPVAASEPIPSPVLEEDDTSWIPVLPSTVVQASELQNAVVTERFAASGTVGRIEEDTLALLEALGGLNM